MNLESRTFFIVSVDFLLFIMLVGITFSRKESGPLCLNNNKTHYIAQCLVLPRPNHQNWSPQKKSDPERGTLTPMPQRWIFFFLFKAKTSIPFSTSMIASLSLFTSWACCEQGLVHWVFFPLSRPSSCLTPHWWWKQPWASSARYLHWGFYLSKMNLEQYTLPWVKLIPDILCNWKYTF